jgi:predicted AAA+ superfamily ATPase
LSCGWSKDGLQTFNQLAKEVYKNRKEHGEEFDKAFKKESIKQEMASTNKTGKRKRNCVDTYNDLNEGGLIMKDEENSEDEEQEEWVAKNVFIV